MPAATMQQTPAIPPRPARGQDQVSDAAAGVPKIPPRPIKRFDRSVSPNPARFAPSPLLEGIPQKSPKALRFGSDASQDPIERPSSVSMPNVGEEGLEYSAVATELKKNHNKDDVSSASSSLEQQTSTVAEDLKLHAPKPSLPAHSAKQRVQAVTRTDSDKAAQFGIGRSSESDRAVSRDGVKKKRSTSTFSNADESQTDLDDEQGIPEIGQRVPMNPHLGDVQAPSPAPGSEEPRKHHHRKTSSRGGPPGSYGLHGHGVAPQDKFEKAYYEKHPDLLVREHKSPLHDRQNDYAMSSNDLNRLVRDTASRASGGASSSDYHAAPTDEVAFQATEELASRISSPRPTADDKLRALSFKSEVTGPDGEKFVHVDDPEHPEYRSYGDRDSAVVDEEHEYTAPILASDEVNKDTPSYLQQPAVHPPPERRGSAAERDEPTSRPSSRPTSIYKENNSSQDFGSTPLEDVKEYEPLFDEDGNKVVPQKPTEPIDPNKARHYRYFPSKDMWEDTPNSLHYTAEVSTPDLAEEPKRKAVDPKDRPKTPAHAFAQIQEQLAEKEKFSGPAGMYQPRSEAKQIWNEQPKSPESFLDQKRPVVGQRFPSRDVWEDVPESHVYEAEVSASPVEEQKTESPPVKQSSESSERPAVPVRPKPKHTLSDEAQKQRPPVSDKPKPQIPARPSKTSSGDSKDGEFSKPKPPVPSRPVGGKIAALQAGFMSDLNKRLQLGPQAPKKEESQPEEDVTEEKEKAPLADARKSRARGPQRRAPAKSPSAPITAAPAAATPSAPVLSFSISQTLWSIDPEDGNVAISQGQEGQDQPKKVDFVEDVENPAPEPVEAQKPPVIDEPVEAQKPAVIDEPVEAQKPAAIDEPVEADKATIEAAEDAPSESKPEEVSEAEPEKKPQEVSEVAPVEEKTLASNTAGESILEATVEKNEGANEVEPLVVSDQVKA